MKNIFGINVVDNSHKYLRNLRYLSYTIIIKLATAHIHENSFEIIPGFV